MLHILQSVDFFSSFFSEPLSQECQVSATAAEAVVVAVADIAADRTAVGVVEVGVGDKMAAVDVARRTAENPR